MGRRTFRTIAIALLLALAVVSFATASGPEDVTVDTITVVDTNVAPATTALVPVTAEGVGADGARGFDIWFQYDHTNLSLDVDNSVVGADMAALGCGFGLGLTYDDGTQALVSGFCTSGTAAATGDIELVQLKFDLVGDPGTYDITIPANVLGQDSQLTGSNNAAATPTGGYVPGTLTIGDTATAVTLAGMDANPAAAAVAPLWPLLAGGAAVAAGAGYVLLRRKR